MELHKVDIIAHMPLSKNAFLLTLQKTHPFKAGQSVAISINNSIPPRLYSICSGTGENSISILYKIVPEGTLTPQLSKLAKGDSLMISEPMGSFIHEDKQGFWIASGTGIAPFLSMLQSGIQKPHQLIFGSRTDADVYFKTFLKDKLQDKFTSCISRENIAGAYHGRITQWLKQTENLALDIKYYLCGSPEMVVDVRDILIEKGVPFTNISSEIYF